MQAGWHPDPSGQFEQRYWDGTAWTEHVFAGGAQAVAPLARNRAEARALATSPTGASAPAQNPLAVEQVSPAVTPAAGVQNALVLENIPLDRREEAR